MAALVRFRVPEKGSGQPVSRVGRSLGRWERHAAPAWRGPAHDDRQPPAAGALVPAPHDAITLASSISRTLRASSSGENGFR
jgi:hypothetical protein